MTPFHIIEDYNNGKINYDAAAWYYILIATSDLLHETFDLLPKKISDAVVRIVSSSLDPANTISFGPKIDAGQIDLIYRYLHRSS